MANNKISPLANGGSASSEVPDTYYPPEDIQRELQVLLNRPQEPRQADFFGRSAPQGIQRRGEPIVNPFRFLQEAGRGALGMEPQMQRGSAAYRAGQALSAGPGAAATLPGKLAGSGADVLAGLGAAAGVIKPKGGNWLAGSIERATQPLRFTTAGMEPAERIRLVDQALAQNLAENNAVSPEFLARMERERRYLQANAAINKWIDTKLNKYIRNEMGTPEDPVRALAERGTLHFEPQGGAVRSHTMRAVAGMPTEPTATTPLARAWEDVSDAAVMRGQYQDMIPFAEWGEEGLRKYGGEYAVKNPQAVAYAFDTGALPSDMGFPHIIDELSNAMNPNSGLPASLRMQPKDLEKITVPQAVEKVAKINEWRAAQKAEADALKARNPATFEYRAYEIIPGTAEPNQKRMRWVELKLPEIKELPPGYSVKPMSKEGRFAVYGPDGQSTGAVGRSPEEAIANQQVGRQPLEDALKYEGEVMGHCVGGYCPDVIEGRSKIYSLRDKKGEPHVTIEVTPFPKYDSDFVFYELQDRLGRAPTQEEWDAAMVAKPPIIAQIKGKGNKAPKEEYLPFVQDFVRSGNWSDVNDLQNTGLIAIDRGSDLAAAMKAENATIPQYVTQEELTELLRKYKAYGYKRGGAVKSSSDMTGMNLFDILRTV